MVTVHVCSKLETNWKSIVFTNKVGKNSRYFVGVFNKTIIPFALVGYKMIIANTALRALLAIIVLYPTHTRGMFVKYRKIPKISPSKYKPPKPVTQKTPR